jgi:RNA polymerase sigma factor (sigma-70 family)
MTDSQEVNVDSLVSRASAAFGAYRSGERSAFDDLVNEMTPLLWQVVRGQGVDRVQAEDIIQTAWMNLLHSSASIQEPRAVVKWLITTTKREAWRVSGRSRDEAKRSTELFTDEGAERITIPAPREHEPDLAAVRKSDNRALWDQVASLSAKCRELIRVIAFADRPDYAVIAESLGMPVGSIGPTRGRCLAKLRTALEQDPAWEVGV